MKNTLKAGLWSQFNSILVVDDDNVLLSFLKDILEEEGFDVVTFDNAQEASTTLSANSFSVAIIDINMPGFSGLEILKQLKTKDSQTKVIINTGTKSLETAKQALNYGAFAYVEKFEDPETLLNYVLLALKEQLYESAKEIRREEELQNLNDREFNQINEILVERGNDGLIIKDDNTSIYANQEVAQLFEVERRDFSEKPLNVLFPYDQMFPDPDSEYYEGNVVNSKGKKIFIEVSKKKIMFRKKEREILFFRKPYGDRSMAEDLKTLQIELQLCSKMYETTEQYIHEHLNQISLKNKDIQLKTDLEPVLQLLEIRRSKKIKRMDIKQILKKAVAENGNEQIKLTFGRWQDQKVQADEKKIKEMFGFIIHRCQSSMADLTLDVESYWNDSNDLVFMLKTNCKDIFMAGTAIYVQTKIKRFAMINQMECECFFGKQGFEVELTVFNAL